MRRFTTVVLVTITAILIFAAESPMRAPAQTRHPEIGFSPKPDDPQCGPGEQLYEYPGGFMVCEPVVNADCDQYVSPFCAPKMDWGLAQEFCTLFASQLLYVSYYDCMEAEGYPDGSP